MGQFDFCKSCPLEKHPCMVPAKLEGSRPVMIVTEAPQVVELRSKTLLGCTPGGRELLKNLKEAGFTMEDIVMTSVLKCPRPHKSVEWDHAEAIDICGDNLLKREFLYYKPKLVIGLGNFNLRYWLGMSSGIIKKSGTFHEITMREGNREHTAMLMPLLTPEYVMYNMEKLPSFRRAIASSYQTYRAAVEGVPDNKWRVLTDLETVLTALDFLNTQKIISFDLETTGLDPVHCEFRKDPQILGIGFSWGAHIGFYIPTYHRERLDIAEDCDNCQGVGRVDTGKITKTGKKATQKCPVCKGEGIKYLPSDLVPFWSADVWETIRKRLKDLFLSPGRQWVAHNLGFEHKWMLQHWDINLQDVYDQDPYSLVDTMLYAYFRDPFTKDKGRFLSLGHLTSKYPDLVTLKNIWDPVPKKAAYDLTLYHPLEKYGTYCCGDCDGTYRLWSEYLPELKNWKPQGFNQYEFFFQKLMQSVLFVSEMHQNGVPCDEVRMAAADVLIRGREQEILEDMKSRPWKDLPTGRDHWLPDDFNPDSTPKLQHWCFNVLKLPKLKHPKRNKKEKISTEGEVLEKWLHQYGVEFAKTMLDYRGVSVHRKNLVTSVAQLRNPVTGCVHPNLKMWGTETGRLSVSDPAMHGMPSIGPWAKAVRSQFQAPEGWKIMGADYSQIELRMAADDSECKALLEAYSKGLDMHSFTGSLVFDISYELMDKELHPENQWMRRIGKTGNFAWIYNGAATVVIPLLGNHLIPDHVIESEFGADPKDKLTLKIPEKMLVEYAEKYHTKYFKAYHELVPWAEKAKALCRERGYAISRYGRVRYLPEINSRDPYTRSHAENQAVNHPIQSAASDYLLFRFQDIVKVARAEKYPVKPMLTIHDALYMLVRDQDVEDVSEIVKTVGVRQDEAGWKVPMVLEPKVGQGFDAFVE